MTHSYCIAFGAVSTRIEFDDELSAVAEIIRYWLRAGLQPENRTPDIIFSLLPGDSEFTPSPDELAAGTGRLGDDYFGCWDERGWENRVSIEADGGTDLLRWSCRPKNNSVLAIAQRVPAALLRLAHPHYFSYKEMLASTFLYRQLIPAIQSVLLRRSASLLHASALRHSSGAGILVAGWGGSGKTSASSVLYLNNPSEWQYLSDDLAIVGSDGSIHLSPIPLNIFPYNTQQFKELEDAVIGNMGMIEKAQWRAREFFLGSGSVARRTPPIGVEGKGSATRLALTIHLQRFSGRDPKIHKATAAELARIAKNVLAYELRHALPTYTLANAFSVGRPNLLQSPDGMAGAAERILERAFSRAAVVAVSVPRDYRPVEVSELVERVARDLAV